MPARKLCGTPCKYSMISVTPVRGVTRPCASSESLRQVAQPKHLAPHTRARLVMCPRAF